jgi:hypothetical protein
MKKFKNNLFYILMNTTNKSNRDLNIKFNQVQFNKDFDEADIKNMQYNPDLSKDDEIISSKLPHQRSMEDIVIIMRDMIYKILELLIEKKNPLTYINSSLDKQYSFSLILIILGTLLLLLSGLMMDK